MGVIDVEGHIPVELPEIPVLAPVMTDDALESGGHEEILLHQP